MQGRKVSAKKNQFLLIYLPQILLNLLLVFDCVSMSVQVLGMGIYMLKKINIMKIVVTIETFKEIGKS